MSEQATQQPQIEVLKTERPPQPMSGDSIIANPDIAYDTAIVLPVSPDEAWAGRFGITRMGAVTEGYAGPLLPARFDQILPEHMRSLPADAPEPKRLKVGDSIPDGHKDDRATVVQLDEEARTMVLDMQWTSKNHKPGLHYTWQLTVEPGESDNTAMVVARTRMENIKHNRAGQLVFPYIDRYAMKIVGEAISRDDSAPLPKQTMKQKIGSKALQATGTFKTARARHSTKR